MAIDPQMLPPRDLHETAVTIRTLCTRGHRTREPGRPIRPHRNLSGIAADQGIRVDQRTVEDSCLTRRRDGCVRTAETAADQCRTAARAATDVHHRGAG